jgi:hypothetical protein
MINNTFVIHKNILFHQHTWQRLSEKRSGTIHFFDRIIFIQKVCELEWYRKWSHWRFWHYIHYSLFLLALENGPYHVVTNDQSPKMFSNDEFSLVEFDCCLRERTVPILPSFIQKNQLIVRFYFLILSRLLSRTIKTKNEIEY